MTLLVAVSTSLQIVTFLKFQEQEDILSVTMRQHQAQPTRRRPPQPRPRLRPPPPQLLHDHPQHHFTPNAATATSDSSVIKGGSTADGGKDNVVSTLIEK